MSDKPGGPDQTGDVSGALEALLLLAEEPMSVTELASAVGAPTTVVEDCLAELVAFYDETGRGFELREVGGGWRYYTRAEHAELISAYLVEGRESRLSQAALETLAVVAYSQPISRGRIAAVRGVNVDGVIKTLLTRGLVAEAGHDHDSGALQFVTTAHFLERMGLRSLDELPPIAPLLPDAEDLEAELSLLASPAPVPDPAVEDPDSPPVDGGSRRDE